MKQPRWAKSWREVGIGDLCLGTFFLGIGLGEGIALTHAGQFSGALLVVVGSVLLGGYYLKKGRRVLRRVEKLLEEEPC